MFLNFSDVFNSSREIYSFPILFQTDRQTFRRIDCLLHYSYVCVCVQVITKNRMFNNAGRLKVNMGNIFFKVNFLNVRVRRRHNWSFDKYGNKTYILFALSQVYKIGNFIHYLNSMTSTCP